MKQNIIQIERHATILVAEDLKWVDTKIPIIMNSEKKRMLAANKSPIRAHSPAEKVICGEKRIMITDSR